VFSFIETQLFTRLVKQYLSDEQYAELQQDLIDNPELGPVIAGTGGGPKAALGGSGSGETRRIPPQGCYLDADDVPKECGRFNSSSCAERNSRGTGR
jgi:hypothetical protein